MGGGGGGCGVRENETTGVGQSYVACGKTVIIIFSIRNWSSYKYYPIWNGSQSKTKSGNVYHGVRNCHNVEV